MCSDGIVIRRLLLPDVAAKETALSEYDVSAMEVGDRRECLIWYQRAKRKAILRRDR